MVQDFVRLSYQGKKFIMNNVYRLGQFLCIFQATEFMRKTLALTWHGTVHHATEFIKSLSRDRVYRGTKFITDRVYHEAEFLSLSKNGCRCRPYLKKSFLTGSPESNPC